VLHGRVTILRDVVRKREDEIKYFECTSLYWLSYYVLNLDNGALKGVCNFNIVKFVFEIVCELQILMKLKNA